MWAVGMWSAHKSADWNGKWHLFHDNRITYWTIINFHERCGNNCLAKSSTMTPESRRSAKITDYKETMMTFVSDNSPEWNRPFGFATRFLLLKHLSKCPLHLSCLWGGWHLISSKNVLNRSMAVFSPTHSTLPVMGTTFLGNRWHFSTKQREKSDCFIRRQFRRNFESYQ